MSDATPGTTAAALLNDHADEALTILDDVLASHIHGNAGATIALAQVHATLALVQEMAALRLAVTSAMADAFGAPEFDSNENRLSPGGTVIHALSLIPAAMP